MIINISMAIYNINNNIIIYFSINIIITIVIFIFSLCSIPCYFNNAVFALSNYTLECINLDFFNIYFCILLTTMMHATFKCINQNGLIINKVLYKN